MAMRDQVKDSADPDFPRIGERTVVQRTFLAAAQESMPDDMYSRIEYGAAIREREQVVIEPHSKIHTNTYFGRLPASYWQRWTSVTEVEVSAVARGTGRVSVVASDSAGVPRTVAARDVSEHFQGPVRLMANIDRFLDGGALWIEATSGTEPLTIEDVRWSASGQRRRPNAVVICTHNRADDCLTTLEGMSGDVVAMDVVDAVYVVDQGSDPVEARARFDEVRRVMGDKLRYFRQANLGGAGGFTRGLCEAMDAAPEETNVLLMDDDIVLEPDTLVRVLAFGERTTGPVLVGGQMLGVLHPQQLLADAEDFNPVTLRVGLPVTTSLARSNMLRRRQEVRVDAPYNAWWTCLVPSEAVRRIGHPLPFFFQWDDVEFGVRARGGGIPTVTLPGAGVWHTDLHWKNWDDWARYFHFRNGLVVSALHSPFDTAKITRNLAWELACCLVSMQYGLAATMLKAVEDFLRGPSAFADGGAQVSVEVHKFRAEFPETVVQPAADVPNLATSEAPLVRDPGAPSLAFAILVKRLLWQLSGRCRPAAAISAKDARWWHMSLFRTAIVTDPSQEGVRVYRQDRDLMFRLARRSAKVLWRFCRESGAVRREYEAAMPELTGRANWHRLFTTR